MYYASMHAFTRRSTIRKTSVTYKRAAMASKKADKLTVKRLKLACPMLLSLSKMTHNLVNLMPKNQIAPINWPSQTKALKKQILWTLALDP